MGLHNICYIDSIHNAWNKYSKHSMRPNKKTTNFWDQQGIQTGVLLGKTLELYDSVNSDGQPQS